MLTSISPIAAVLSGLLVGGLLGLESVHAAQGPEHHKLLADDGLAGDNFGSAVATDGTLVAIGAPRADELGTDSGSAYVFEALSGGQRLELVPTNGNPLDQFGASIAIDGNLVVVGAPLADPAGSSSGTVYGFDATTGVELFELAPLDPAAGKQFGFAVALDGGLVVVGSLGAAYLFDASTGQQLQKLLPDEGTVGGFGEAVDIDADRVLVGARTANGTSGFSGAAYLFDATTGNQLHRLTAIFGTAWEFFGKSVGIDGNTVVIGAPEAGPKGKHSGTAYLFDADTGQQTQKLVPNDGHSFAKFGSSVGVDGPHVFVGAEQDNGGGFSAGAAYVYDTQGSVVVKLIPSDAEPLDDFGAAVAVARGVLVSGSPRDDDLGDDSGSAYVFDEAGTVTDMTECFGNLGALDHVGGMAVAGQTLVLRMDTAQPGATQALLIAALAPVPGWPSCGVRLKQAGELLIHLAPSSRLVTSSAPWSGSSVDFAVGVPPMSGLVGVQAFFQGAFLGSSSLPEPMRLTGGLQVVLGGYL